MRSRTKSDDTRGQQRDGQQEREREREKEREKAREKEQPRDAERAREARVPKIQYRFLKELEERPLSQKEVRGAYDMADKIRRYPLEASAVMSSWERFTKTAIEDFKAGRGDNDVRDQQHRAYALVYSALRDEPGAKDLAELKGRVRSVELKNSEIQKFAEKRRVVAEDQTGAKGQEPRKDERSVTEKLPPREQVREQARDQLKTKEAARDVPTQKAVRPKEGRTATQRTLALPEQTSDKARAELDARVDKMLGKLRQDVPVELRRAIEGTAIEMIVDGFHTQKSARADLADAVEALRKEKNVPNTVNALTLATIARVATHGTLLDEIRQKNGEEQKEIIAEARKRLERYPALESGISLVHRDQVAAAVRDVLEPSMESHKEALVLARARVELEAVADPKRFSWERVAAEMELVSEPG